MIQAIDCENSHGPAPAICAFHPGQYLVRDAANDGLLACVQCVRDGVVRCNCAGAAPTMPLYRDKHLETCPAAALSGRRTA